MKKYLLLICLFSFLVLSCSDDDNDNLGKINQMERDIVGIWVPNPKPNNPSEIIPAVLYFNKDKTASVHEILSVTDGKYELSEGKKMINIRIEEYLPEQTNGHVHKLVYQDPDKNNKYGEYLLYHVSSDSLSIQLSSIGAFKKVPSINLK